MLKEAKVLSLDLATSPVSSKPLNKQQVSIKFIFKISICVWFQQVFINFKVSNALKIVI